MLHMPQNRTIAARTGTGFLRIVTSPLYLYSPYTRPKWAAVASVFKVPSGPRWRSRRCNIPAHGGGAGDSRLNTCGGAAFAGVLFFVGVLPSILYTMLFYRHCAIPAHILNKVCQAHKTPVSIVKLTENSPKKILCLVIFFLDKTFQQRFFGNTLHKKVEKPLKNLYNSHKKLFRQNAQSRA